MGRGVTGRNLPRTRATRGRLGTAAPRGTAALARSQHQSDGGGQLVHARCSGRGSRPPTAAPSTRRSRRRSIRCPRRSSGWATSDFCSIEPNRRCSRREASAPSPCGRVRQPGRGADDDEGARIEILEEPKHRTSWRSAIVSGPDRMAIEIVETPQKKTRVRALEVMARELKEKLERRATPSAGTPIPKTSTVGDATGADAGRLRPPGSRRQAVRRMGR